MTTKSWVVSLAGLILTIILVGAAALNAFASVQNDVRHLKEQQAKFLGLDDIVRDMQITLAKTVTNQDNIIRLLEKMDGRIRSLEVRNGG